ncbi:MAG: hypothetical protein ACI4MH_04645 [Candidatus Coproplasma sp.]
MKNIILSIIKYVICAVVFIAALIVVGIINVNTTRDVEAKKASYTRTQFDYFISSPDKSQVESIEALSSVDKVFPFYAFSNAFSNNSDTKEIFLLISDDMDDYDISLFTEKTLVSGSFDKNGIMLDQLAAEKLGASVGSPVTFNILGRSVTKNVSAIYMTSTYGGLTNGIALVDFSAEISAVYTPKAYNSAFLTANDKAAVRTDLYDYVGEGNVALSYEEFVDIRCDTQPPYWTQEQYEADCAAKYAEYREDILSAARRGGKQVAAKEDSYALLKDKIATTEKSIETLNLLTAISALALYLVVNVIFIFADRGNDRIRCESGMSGIVMFLKHTLSTLITAVAIAGIVFGVLFIVASATPFIDACMITLLAASLPVVVAVPVVMIFDAIYVKLLYSSSAY